MQQSTPNFRAILSCLATHRVDFIVVGGVGAVLQGAPIATFDLDIVHDRSAVNVTRLLAALEELDAIFRDPAGRRIRPLAHHLLGEGQCLLSTTAGPLDVLGEIGDKRRFEDLVDDVRQFKLDETLCVSVLDLATLVLTKEEAGRPKDLAVLPVLRQTLAERDRR